MTVIAISTVTSYAFCGAASCRNRHIFLNICAGLTAVVIPAISQKTEMTPKILRTQVPIHSKHCFRQSGQVCTHAQVASTFRIVLHKADASEGKIWFTGTDFETTSLFQRLFGSL